jgi:Na+/H+-dicarboxylate symporter
MNEIENANYPKNQQPKAWTNIPVGIQVIVTLSLAVIIGSLWGANKTLIDLLALPSELVFKAMQALALPLVFLKIIYVLSTSKIAIKGGYRLLLLLLTNTTVAIAIAVIVFNLFNMIHPAAWGKLPWVGFTVPELCSNYYNSWLDGYSQESHTGNIPP